MHHTLQLLCFPGFPRDVPWALCDVPWDVARDPTVNRGISRRLHGNPKDPTGSHGIPWDSFVVPVGTHGNPWVAPVTFRHRTTLYRYIVWDQWGLSAAISRGLSPRATTPALFCRQSTRHLVVESSYPGYTHTTKLTSLSAASLRAQRWAGGLSLLFRAVVGSIARRVVIAEPSRSLCTCLLYTSPSPRD